MTYTVFCPRCLTCAAYDANYQNMVTLTEHHACNRCSTKEAPNGNRYVFAYEAVRNDNYDIEKLRASLRE